jgi:DNA-binding NarL/FixJ family response regulator
MNIVWLEDEPETIDIIKYQIEDYLGKEVMVCQSFVSFSNEVQELEDRADNIIIIDIRMIFNREMHFTCFEKVIKVKNDLDSGFEYFNNCLKDRFEHIKIIFFSSKPQTEAVKDAKKHEIDTNLIVSKDYTTELLKIIKGIK